jgi:hypothetical protein
MSKKSSDSLPIIIILGLAALTFLGKVIFDNLVYTWLMRELQHRFGLQEATVIAGFAAVALRLLAAMVVVGGLYLYLQREFEQRFVAATPTAPTSSEAELSEAKRKMMKEERAARREEFERARQSQSVPDWPIHELFSHRGPDLFDRPDEALWDAIGNDLRDALSLGRLRIWGRPMTDGIARLLGDRPAMRLIEPQYWELAHFTYAFFDETAGGAAHTWVETNSELPEYADLQLNRAEALSIWPDRLPQSPADVNQR